jgi:hypothetical protein
MVPAILEESILSRIAFAQPLRVVYYSDFPAQMHHR